MKPAEVRKLSMEEIIEKINETRNEYMLMRFQYVSGQLTDTSKLNSIRHLIARLETILREKKLSETSAEGEA